MTITEQPLLDAMQKRYSVKAFDPTQKIEKEMLDTILEAGRLSPSSFGIEPWHFLVIRDQQTKESLKPLCWDQAQITTCSDLILFLTRKDLSVEQNYVPSQFKRWGLNEDSHAFVLNLYKNFTQQFDSNTLPHWAGKQAYIALGNMMTAAQVFGVGSCPIEGFDNEKVMQFLDIDEDQYHLHVMLALGTPADEPRTKHRLALSEITTFV